MHPCPGHDAWCLFLDVDGTLLEIAPTPAEVHVDDTLRRLMLDASLALGGAMALVSGRTVAALDALFHPQRWPAAGLHGLERRDAAGVLHRHAPEPGRLDAMRPALLQLAARTAGVKLEDKGPAIAMHYRAAPQAESALRVALAALVADLTPEYHLLEGRQVFEIKPAAVTKADAVFSFMQEAPFAGRRPIYAGDDITDLDGFAAVDRMGGLSVAVGDSVQAQRRVSSPREVRMLLAGVAERHWPAS